MGYQPADIEGKWQKYWHDHGCFRSGHRDDLPKYYVLDMFPYPSGSGLHVGHVEGYTATDIIARYKRMKGFDVLHPMGWDAFGLPAEQYAIDQGVHPEVSTRQNIDNFRGQLQQLGFSYDWERECGTLDPQFYHWTQWIFLKLYEHGLAYQDEATVNWCPALGTVLANDEVIEGKSERGGHEVIQKPMKQWMLRITAYADRLLEGLDRIDFPESLKAMQRERIGRSEGADAAFTIDGHDDDLKIFTTRPDTMMGATFCVLAPEHPLVEAITTPEHRAEVQAYVDAAHHKSEIERSGSTEKTGAATGAHAINPMTGKRVPIWVSDYVLMSYGTGAIMCVPGHDQRDWEFATKFDLPIVEVITGGDITQAAWDGEGTMVNSGFMDGMNSRDAIGAAIDWLVAEGRGERVVRYKMRDWIFARQRYWGEPVPIVYDEEGTPHPLPDSALPLELPPCEDFKPSVAGESPLGRIQDWVSTTVPGTDRPGRRETDTMPGSAGSSWYFLRYLDPTNTQVLCDPAIAKRWMPVDLYIGGAEHAVGHLIYARFWTKFLFDIGACPVDEPFKKLVNQGMILGEDNRKMGKRYGNTVDPRDIVASHGADTLRMYEMFMGPIDVDAPWQMGGVEGVRRFLNKVWRLFFDEDDRFLEGVSDVAPAPEIQRVLHRTIAKVDHDTENLRFNTAISRMMEFVNEMTRQDVRPRATLETFVKLLAPYAPHLAEELWHRLGRTELLMFEPYPVAEERWLVDDEIEVPVQVNGKVRDRLTVAADIDEAAIRAAALASDRVKPFVDGKELMKFLYVPGRMVTIAVKGMSQAELVQAIQRGDYTELRRLLDGDSALCDARDENGVSALMLCLYYGRLDHAQAIVDHREAIDIFEASALGQAGVVAKLLAEDPARLHDKSPDGFTPLHLAVFFRQEPTAYLLVNDGADVEARAANRTGVRPLHSAVAGQARGAVKLLLESGADPSPKQTGGYTPLMGAAGAGMLDVVELLIEHGANCRMTSDDGKTARDFAVAKGHDEIVALLDAAR